MRRTFPLWIALLAPSTASALQFPQPEDWLGWPAQITDLTGVLDALQDPQGFGRSDSGRLDRNVDPEIVYLTEDGVVVCFDVNVRKACFLIERAARDVAILPDVPPSQAVQAGEPGLLVLALAGGVAVLELVHDPDQQTLTFTEYLHTGTRLQGLERFVKADLDQDGRIDLVGLPADGQGFIGLIADPEAPGGLTIDPLLAGNTDGQVYDILTIDIDQDGSADLFVATDEGLERFDREGVQVSKIPHAGARGTLATILGPSNRSIVWARESSGSDELVLVGPSGSAAPIDLGPLGIVHMVGADANADGYTDLLLSVSSDPELMLLRNNGGTLDPQNVLYLGIGTAVVQSSPVRPIFRDLNLDGRADLAFAVTSTQQLRIQPSIAMYFEYAVLDAPVPSYLDFGLANHMTWSLPMYCPGTHDRLRIASYIQGPILTPDDIPAPVPVPFDVLLFDHAQAGDGENLVNFPLVPDLSWNSERYITWFEARFVTVDGSDNVIDAGVPYIFAIADGFNPVPKGFLAGFLAHGSIPRPKIGNGEKVGYGGSPPTPPPPPPPSDPP